jgi:hypothetical protein
VEEDQNILANKLINNGEAFKAFKQHAAYPIIKTWLEDKIADRRDQWLKSTPDMAENLRIKAAVYREVLDFFETQIKAGERAANMIEAQKKEREAIERGDY